VTETAAAPAKVIAMSGPRRLRKTQPKPLPAEPPPPPTRLPPTDPATFAPAPELLEYVAAFNREEYRACVEPIEALFFRQRNTFHQGLLQLAVGLMQLRLGLTRGPRTLLRSARELLAEYAPWQEGLAIAPILAHIDAWLAVLAQELPPCCPPERLAAQGPPPLRLAIAPPPEGA